MNITKVLLVALLLVAKLQAQNGAPVGSAAAGKEVWDGKRCLNCHGKQGQGGFGPDLAGRALTFAQFKHAVRKPWGIMPAFTEEQITDQNLADIRAYLTSLPTVPEPGPWDVPAPPPTAPRGQMLLITYGCAQCHDSELRNPREALGGVATDVNFYFFSKIVYEHTNLWRTGRMGNFSRTRLPESILQEIFTFAMKDLGMIPPITGAIAEPMPDGANTTYKIFVKNRGIQGKGLAAEDVTILIALAPGVTVVSGTGTGYQGVQNNPQLKSDAAVWKVPSVGPGETQMYTLTIAGKGAPAVQLFKRSVVYWTKPALRPGIANIDDLVLDGRGPLGPRLAQANFYLDRPVSADGDWLGGAVPPGACGTEASARRGVAGCN